MYQIKNETQGLEKTLASAGLLVLNLSTTAIFKTTHSLTNMNVLMNLLKREQAIGSNALTSLYAPIAKALSTISENNVQAKLIIVQPNFLLVCQMT